MAQWPATRRYRALASCADPSSSVAIDISVFTAELGKPGFIAAPVLSIERRPIRSGKQTVTVVVECEVAVKRATDRIPQLAHPRHVRSTRRRAASASQWQCAHDVSDRATYTVYVAEQSCVPIGTRMRTIRDTLTIWLQIRSGATSMLVCELLS